MENLSFQALVVREDETGVFHRQICSRKISELPANDVLVHVHYSSLNYKDALSASGNRGVTKRYPHTPGIDAAGRIAASSTSDFLPGDEVICTGYDLGMNTPGGLGQYICVPAGWVIHKPSSLSLRETMQIGTAGFTAAQCVHGLLESGCHPDDGPVLVTGATGGVGIIAVALLSQLGYAVTAVTGKESAHALLHNLGVSDIIDRKKALGNGTKMLLRERWGGVVDTVGGEILASAIKSTCYGGAVTCCGNAASGDLPLNVYPFILRGVRLIGIDSAQCPLDVRQSIWEKLAGPWRLSCLDDLSTEVLLPEVSHVLDRMLAGKNTGRVVVDMEPAS